VEGEEDVQSTMGNIQEKINLGNPVFGGSNANTRRQQEGPAPADVSLDFLLQAFLN
jgi:hypothetical protein